MVSNAQIQTVKAEFLDPSLYDDSGLAGIPRLSRGTVLTALSRAFDLAEGRKPGHAQRVGYVGVFLATELGLAAQEVEDMFFGCLLHDAGMAASGDLPRIDTNRGARMLDATDTPGNLLERVPAGGWNQVVEAVAHHCALGASIARQLGLGEAVAAAVAGHHDCWDGSGNRDALAGQATPIVSRIVALADRFESMVDGERSPLLMRRRGPALVREMAGREVDPELAETLSGVAARDEFWLGLYDNDLASSLMTLNFGGLMGRDETLDFFGVIADIVDRRNQRGRGRGRRVAEMARKTALVCDMTERRAELVKAAALLQDIGTLGVPVQYLSKPDILTIEEMTTVQTPSFLCAGHPERGPRDGFGGLVGWVPPRTDRWQGLPGDARRTRGAGRSSGYRDVRGVRRAHQRPPLPAGNAPGGGVRGDARAGRHAV